MNNDKAAMFKPMGEAEKQHSRPRKPKGKDAWEPFNIVPNDAGLPPLHYKHGTPSASYEYRNVSGGLVCRVHRFDLGNGDKEVLPLSYCKHRQSGKQEWRWKGSIEPRPIYNAHLLAQHPKTCIVLCEGEKAVNACARLLPNHIAVTTLGGSNAAHKANWGTLARREVIIWPDADDPGMKYAEDAAKALQLVSAQVKVIIPPKDVLEGWDAADAELEGWDDNETLSFLRTAKPINEVFQYEEARKKTAPDKANRKGKKGGGVSEDDEEPGGRIPQRDLILSLMDEIELWHDKKRIAYVSFYVNDHWENWPLRSRDFKIWLYGHYYHKFEHAPGSQAIEDGLKTMEAEAIHHNPRYDVARRIGEMNDHIYLDLCNDVWGSVEVSEHGWRIIDRAPVKFLRSGSMAPLPEPELGETIERLRDFIKVESEQDFRLMVAWLVGALSPKGPYPILLINGAQGAAKTYTSNKLKQIIDPSIVKNGNALPNNERDLMISATNNRVLFFDNASYIAPWLSDALCRVATGGGYATRELHSDMGEVVLEANCPMVLNGIPDLASRPDLGDRSIFVELAAIPDKERRGDREIGPIFDKAHPGVLGALLDAVSAALRNIHDIKLDEAPRMIEFVEWITAAEQGLGWKQYSFIHILKQNKDNAIRSAAEDDPLIQAVLFIANEGGFKGAAAALMERINGYVSESLRRSTGWPKSPSAMGTAMRRITPTLRILEVHAEKGKEQGNRHWIIRKSHTE